MCPTRPSADAPAFSRPGDWGRLVKQLARRGERRLVLVEGDRDAALAWLRALLLQLPVGDAPGLWAGRSPPVWLDDLERVSALTPKDAGGWLGRSSRWLVLDGWQGNPPDAWAALAGTLAAGGLLFWLMPPLSQWRQWPDPDYRRVGLDHDGDHPFADRLAQVLAADDSVIRVTAEAPERTRLPELADPDAPFRVAGTPEQAALVAQIVRFGQGRRRRPLVIRADRGRGKSAALGQAAARLLQEGRRSVLVTAPSRAQVDTLFAHAEQALGDSLAEREAGGLITADGARLTFCPPDELLANRPDAEVLLVDEAAALPPGTLTQCLTGWPRVAFCTTVNGYEGTGRGFEVRFQAVLDRITPQWRLCRLRDPIRWARSDPLEALVDRLFLLSASKGEDVGEPAAGPLTIAPWRPATASDAERREAFGLLVDAHYRTHPSDLRQWLDDPAALSWVARRGDRLVGVLWGTVEGGFSAGLAAQVANGERRLRGHLLAQSLANHGGEPDAARLRLLRVVRVAVSAEQRRLGVGRQLLSEALIDARARGLDAVGSSFGGTSDLLAFWRSSGFTPVRLGFQREASSGEYPLQVLTGLNASGDRLTRHLHQRLARFWCHGLPRHWPTLAPALVLAISGALPAREDAPEPGVQDDLSRFAGGHWGLALCLPALKALIRMPGYAPWLAGQADASLWTSVVLQERPWATAQASGLCLGARDGEDRLRRLVAAWLARDVPRRDVARGCKEL
ncbi:GNAT family N-acetyltransferase [Marinobacter sp. C2H3]|uniref:GNAT family N-acetyltransferase n=1 Tax=Marinobacter sp. C2H3 TaxID=3119003 RepID=UPI00300F2602